MPYYEYPRPAVTVDVVLIDPGKNELLLIQRKHDPFSGSWALPGGFVDEHEALESAALRELKEETSIELESLVQFRTYGDPGRDPRGHTVSVVFVGQVESQSVSPKAQDDAAALAWFQIAELPPLAFDHQVIIEEALDFLNLQGEGRKP
ncbi:MAG: NUDIX hydrolase [Pontiellaceae bacterium]|nr:NUDIX hydrolase [Pontiellaceae bacterium]MBN2784291.1 NUDIX hydrolase [Pontiellaceae bacterium]